MERAMSITRLIRCSWLCWSFARWAIEVSIRDAAGSVAGESARALRLVIRMIWQIVAISSLIMSFRAQKVTVMLATVILG